MRKIWLVVKREYLTRVRTKGFILSTVGLPLFSVGIFAFTLALATRKADHPLKISILDNLGGLAPQILLGLKEKLPDGQPRFQVVRAWDRPASASDGSRGIDPAGSRRPTGWFSGGAEGHPERQGSDLAHPQRQ